MSAFRLRVKEHPLGGVFVSAPRRGGIEARKRALVRALDTEAS